MKKRPSSTQLLAVGLFLLACILGVLSHQQSQPQPKIPRARYNDAAPLGGKGLRLLAERLNYKTRLESGAVTTMPKDARLWFLLDPMAYFSLRESKELLTWVENGGTLVWAMSPTSIAQGEAGNKSAIGIRHLKRTLGISSIQIDSKLYEHSTEPLPPLTPLRQNIVSPLWNGVADARASAGSVSINRRHLPLAKDASHAQLVQIPYGKGHVFVTADALLFTNYALSKPDTAVLVSNIIRLHAPQHSLIIFDERQHGETEQKFEENWLYYLMRPPLRYAVFQLLAAALLVMLLYGRRLGSPVPLPDAGPVTRASQWAQAMGALFQKAHRPQAAGEILNEHFRRQLTRRLGLSINDSDELIANRAAQVGGGSAKAITHLLQRTRAASGNEAQVLHDAQEMEKILRSLESGEF